MNVDQIVAGVTALLCTVCFLVFIKSLRSSEHTRKVNIITVGVSFVYAVWLILLIWSVLAEI